MQKILLALASILCFAIACREPNTTNGTTKGEPTETSNFAFENLESTATGIDFANMVPYNDTFNCYTFRNFYNGGGVGMGDINNDGLLDLFFCGNMAPNRLYLNLGNWKFKDITESCGMGLSKTWTAGVAIADVNGDGWLDIYTCKSGPLGGPDRHNELFINAGAEADGLWKQQFQEQSAAWKLDNRGLSTHAAFFDYDRDGDLDCYLLNNSVRSVGGYDLRPGQRNTPDPEGGNKLLRNDGAAFTDVTQAAGIYASAIGFGLGVTIGDYDLDGWQDIFVSNDFFERDYLYHNEGNGKFKEVLEEKMPEISKGSMGADMADLNNDGYPEVFVTEMTPPDDARYKTKAAFDDWNTYQLMLQTGYHRQFGRNVLQLNQQGQYFSEIGRMAGVHFSDWSWGALIADFDNDGHKDIFVANGIGKDLLDQDYTNFYADPSAVQNVLRNNPGQGIKSLIDKMPEQPVANCLFRQLPNDGHPIFENVAAAVNIGQPSFSNGSAYGDLDNDGDLDLVVNNVNAACSVFRSNASGNGNNWLKIRAKGTQGNPFALGAKIKVEAGGQTFYSEIAPMRGFESCVDARPNVGVGLANKIDRLTVDFPNGQRTIMEQLPVNQIVEVVPQGAPIERVTAVATTPLLEQKSLPKVQFKESNYSDFDREALLFRMNSTEGPRMAIGDVDGNGTDDMFICAPKGEAAQLLLGKKDGSFVPKAQAAFVADAPCEDSDAAFFDADGDGDLDLYVASGSSELDPGAPALQDRFYLNDGKGNFKRKPDALMEGKPFSTGCVAPADVDGDGDTDVFLGMRMVPGHYGQPPASIMLLNDGKGYFTPAMQEYPELAQFGMVTDAAWADLDGDRDPDLVVCGEWEPIRVCYNLGGRLQVTALPNSEGWWNTLEIADLDKDGQPDIVAGNHGTNSRFKANQTKPISLYINDFDGNGRDETVLCQFNGDKAYPLPLRNDMVRQMPILKKKYLQFDQYKNQTIEQIFDVPTLAKATKKQAVQLASGVFYNKGGQAWEWQILPSAAQTSPIHALLVTDVNGDGQLDLLAAGNHAHCKPETGVYLASRGVLLLGQQQRKWVEKKQSGLDLRGSTRGFALANGHVLASQNGLPLTLWRIVPTMNR
jgi:enediyne biosynthesis protein E4